MPNTTSEAAPEAKQQQNNSSTAIHGTSGCSHGGDSDKIVTFRKSGCILRDSAHLLGALSL